MKVITLTRFLVISLPVFFLCSCATYKNFDYAAIDSVKSLEGAYYNTNSAISDGFDVWNKSLDEAYKSTDIFKIEFSSPKTLDLFYLSDKGWRHVKSHKGKYNKKKHTFDIWNSRKIYPFIILFGYDFDKVRIGKDKENNLVLNHAHDNAGIVIPLGAGGERYSTLKRNARVTEFPPIPVLKNGKWGYDDIDGNKLIEARFDSVCLFEDSVARVRIGAYWALINREGAELTPFKYQRINPCFYKNHFEVYSGIGKKGLIRYDGTEVVPPFYERIDYINNNLVILRNGEKKGIATFTRGLVYPPVFNRIYNNMKDSRIIEEQLPAYIASVDFDGEILAADSDGYLYHLDYARNEPVILESKIHYTKVISENIK